MLCDVIIICYFNFLLPSFLSVNIVYDVNNFTIVRLVSQQHDETLQQCRYVNFLTRIKTHAQKSQVPNAKNLGRWHVRGGGYVLLEKKHYWNNIGRCRFEEQNARNPAKPGTQGALQTKKSCSNRRKQQAKLVTSPQNIATFGAKKRREPLNVRKRHCQKKKQRCKLQGLTLAQGS